MGDVKRHFSNKAEGVILSPAAKAHFLAYLAQQNGSVGLRLSVKKTGCSGLSYVVDAASSIKETDYCFPFTDVFQLLVDKNSYPYLKGVSIDYVKQGLNYKLIFTNPNQSGQCGCGESFTVD